MITNLKNSKFWLYGSLLVFVAFAIYLLSINQEVFYTAQDRSEFLLGADYFRRLLLKPFGLIQYVGAWLTQFFYHPAVGSSILLVLWMLIFYVGTKAFRLEGHSVALMLLPIACLLTSMVDLGYWIYILTIRGYWFSQTVGYLVMLMLLWSARCTPRQWHLVWYLLGVCLYPILGWFSLLFVVCLALTDKMTWRELMGIIMLVFTASIWRALLYSNQNIDAVLMAGFPRFIVSYEKYEYLSIPFWVLGAISMILPLSGKYLCKWFVPVASTVAGILLVSSLMFQDKNYIDEMRMVRYAEDDNWEDVLRIAEENPNHTMSMIMLQNVALMHDGGLLERSFKMGNSITPMYNPDSLHVSFLEIAAPVVYYNYGMINEGFRLAFECAEQAGFSPCYLKKLSRCALANGEMPLVQRYTAQLHGHPYYAHWQPAPANEKIFELKHAYPNELTGVENSYNYVINSICLWYDSDSKLAAEQALFYSMFRCDSKRFWKSIRQFVKTHMDEAFPTHAQEAYILYYDKAPEEKKIKIPVSQEIYNRYKLFWETLENLARSGMDRNAIPDKMSKEFGDTYWYYNLFGIKTRF